MRAPIQLQAFKRVLVVVAVEQDYQNENVVFTGSTSGLNWRYTKVLYK